MLEPIGSFPLGASVRAIGPAVKRYGQSVARESARRFVQLGPHQRADASSTSRCSRISSARRKFARRPACWAQRTEPITDTVQA